MDYSYDKVIKFIFIEKKKDLNIYSYLEKYMIHLILSIFIPIIILNIIIQYNNILKKYTYYPLKY
tara:strand:+ start:853 stop:1047 length:195 start_codon:yes stop_codon:yes gene_type:complete